MKKTIGSVLGQYKGFGPGFDFMRVALATTVLAYHIPPIVNGEVQITRYWDSPIWFISFSVVPAFFALSGFLLAGSATRLKLNDFVINRCLRVIPALAVEIVLSALVLGPIFTTLPLKEYFTNPVFWHYFTNIFGWMNFYLPGVFTDHPETVVNSSLWTIPWEMLAYAMMAAMIVAGTYKRSFWITLGFAAAMMLGAFVCQDIIFADGPRPGFLFALLHLAFVHRGNELMIAFLMGIAFYQAKDLIPNNWTLFGVCVAICIAVCFYFPTAWRGTAMSTLVLVPVLTYMALFLGLKRIPKLPFYSTGDYSYGIYLYGMPVQQTLYDIFRFKNEWAFFFLSVVVATLFATLSWHIVEKNALKLRKNFSFVARQRLGDHAGIGDQAVSPILTEPPPAADQKVSPMLTASKSAAE